MNVNVQYLIIGTHKNTMSNFRSITKNKKKNVEKFLEMETQH